MPCPRLTGRTMGEQSRKFFEEANRLGGIAAKARLASLARVTSTEAVAGVDDERMVERLGGALEALREEYRQRKAANSGSDWAETTASGRAPMRGVSDGDRLRLQLDCIVELLSQRHLTLGEPTLAAQRVNEAAATQLEVARVSVWLLSPGQDSLSCFDVYEASTGGHNAGMRLAATDYGAYFDALRTERTIAAHDAITDPRTSCFAESYLTPLGITSMLDVPVWASGKMIGVLCHEHAGVPRRWTHDEERFAYLMSGFVALAFERDAILKANAS